MSKKTVYSLFVAKFVFSLAMIFWTIKMTLGAGVGTDDDNTFMSYYKEVDANYNEMIIKNQLFENKYMVAITLNDYKIDHLDYNDIYLSQRVIKERKEKKNILHVGKNSLQITVYDRTSGQKIDNFNSEIVFTMPSTHKYDQTVALKNDQKFDITLDQKTFWNVMGKIVVGSEEGRFYIKTNAI